MLSSSEVILDERRAVIPAAADVAGGIVGLKLFGSFVVVVQFPKDLEPPSEVSISLLLEPAQQHFLLVVLRARTDRCWCRAANHRAP